MINSLSTWPLKPTYRTTPTTHYIPSTPIYICLKLDPRDRVPQYKWLQRLHPPIPHQHRLLPANTIFATRSRSQRPRNKKSRSSTISAYEATALLKLRVCPILLRFVAQSFLLGGLSSFYDRRTRPSASSDKSPCHHIRKILANINPPAFAECAVNRTVTATWVCRQQRLAMNSCMVAHANNREEEDRAREEWFATYEERKRAKDEDLERVEKRREEVIRMMRADEERQRQAAQGR